MNARCLIEASLDPLVTINTNGKITDMNEALANITGFEREKLKGTDFLECFTEPLNAHQAWQEVIACGLVADFPLTLRHENGKMTDVLFNGSVLKDDSGNVDGVMIIVRDISKQKWATELRKTIEELDLQNIVKGKRVAELEVANKELAFQNVDLEKRAAELVIANKELVFQIHVKEKSEIDNVELEAIGNSLKLASQYSLSLIEASRDPLITINTKGKITDMNEATVNIIGMTRQELTGSNFMDYFTEPQKAREVYTKVFANGSVADSPLTLRHMNGKLTDVLFNGSIYKDDWGMFWG